MSKRITISGLKSTALVLIFVLASISGRLEGQVLSDSSAYRLVKQTVDLIYNVRFARAEENCKILESKYPDHPAHLLLRGMITYWENYPILSGTEAHYVFEDQLQECIARCDNFTRENEAEILLVNMCARGSLLAFYAGNDMQPKVFSLGRTTYRHLRRSFDFTGTFPDFYFFTGLYNYYREAYPIAHPAYKPIFALFPGGDMKKGLKELNTAMDESIFLRAESATFLSSIFKYFENDYERAAYYSKTISMEYPRNTVYKINIIEDFLLTGQHDEAEDFLETTQQKIRNDYFGAQLAILRAILYEKKYNDPEKAVNEYTRGIEDISSYSSYGDQYVSYGYFGLSRIARMNNDRHMERIYQRRAMEHTSFGSVNFD